MQERVEQANRAIEARNARVLAALTIADPRIPVAANVTGGLVTTAAAASDARIPGLEREEAARLRDRLAEVGEAQAAGL